MKTMKKFLSMAALALVGATFTGCSSDNDGVASAPQQPATNTGNIEILTTTVSLDGDDATRALAADGKKTFAAGETMALVYTNTSGSTVKVVSEPLPAGDHGKSATFTFTLTDPDKTKDVTYIYPAAMANADGSVNYNSPNSQDGTLASLAANLDYCTKSGAWDGDNLPTLTLENQLAILAINLKNKEGSSDITSSITGLTLSDGTYTYNVTPSAAEGPIYVAIFPTADATITVTATDGTKNYAKTLTGKTYAKGNGYPVSWKMAQPTNLSTLSDEYYEAQDGEVLTGTLTNNVMISIADGATVTLKDVNITNLGDDCNWAGITCFYDATLVLQGTNEVCAGRDGYGDNNYPGIWIAPDKTLTIQGAGTLTAYSDASKPYGAGIGGGFEIDCGNIVINSGNITATGGEGAAGIGGREASCGNITINGGTVTATGGQYAAGIGSGINASCGNITINGGNITATGGQWAAGIGSGHKASCGNITIYGGTVTATGGQYAAGIGTGHTKEGVPTSCGTITISGGSVTATGGQLAAGIGTGYNFGGGASCGNITISGGTVSATGGNRAAGIGSGEHASYGNITISGGTITATGGEGAAGIGGCYENGDCGTITIKSTVTSVTAMKGNDTGQSNVNAQSIGIGEDGKTISVTIEDGANVIQN